MLQTSFHAVAPGVSLAAHELLLPGSREENRSLVVLSALGLCALAYRPLAEAFVEASSSRIDAFDGDCARSSPPLRYRRVVFLDLRHHGESTSATEDEDDENNPSSLSWTKEELWETLASDLEAAVESLKFSSPPDVLAHSLGAGVAALACARCCSPRRPLFGSLFLFEPPFYPLVAAAAAAAGGKGEKKRDLAQDNASFAASAAAASSLSFGSREDASSLLEVAPPFKWWHPGCRRAFVEHGMKKKRRRGRRKREGEGGGEEEAEGAGELVFSCGGRALAALASGLLTSARGGPSRETYMALGKRGRKRGQSVIIISYSAEPRSDVTAFLRAGALAASEAAASSASSSSAVVVLPVTLPEAAMSARSGHYAPLVCPAEVGRVAAAAMMATPKDFLSERGERSRF